MSRVFVCDNYDSFTFNLVQYLGARGAEVLAARNDELSIEDIAAWSPNRVVISPGPGDPSSAGVAVDLVRWCADTATPLLGVCLGHQAIGACFGVPTVRAARVMHGKTSLVYHDGRGVFCRVPTPLKAGRYHSLVLDDRSVAAPLLVSARTEDGVVMGIRHERLPLEGVQFHPESVLTAHGGALIDTFLTW